MDINLHLNQKILNEDGRTTISFVSNTDGIIGKDYLNFTIDSTLDTLEMGKDYTISFVEKV